MFQACGARPLSVKYLVAIGVVILGAIIVSQLAYLHDVIFAENVSGSIDIIKACSQAQPRLRYPKDSPAQPATNIPNTIHQIWKDQNVSSYSVEPSHALWISAFEPRGYKIKLWTDDDILKLIKTRYSWLLSTYQAYRYNIQRADVARLLVIHAEGGVYADLDVHPRSIEEMQCLQQAGLSSIFAPTAGTSGVSNHFFMGERESPFLQRALEEATRRSSASRWILIPYLQVFWSTGPMMVTAAALKYAYSNTTNQQRLALLDDRYVRSVVGHAAGRSWHSLDGQFFNYIGDHTEAVKNILLAGVIITFSIIALIFVARRFYRNWQMRKAQYTLLPSV